MTRTFLALAVVFAFVPAHAATTLPLGWFAAGARPSDYDMTIDKGVTHEGRAAGLLRAKGTPGGFGTLMQTFSAERYRGKRVRMSAWAKAESVDRWAGLWMRVDAENKQRSTFDNMQRRPIKGTVAWKRYEVVLDVPSDALRIAFGVLLDGVGAVWVDDFRFEEVDDSVPTTDLVHGSSVPLAPRNLGFEEL
jgi:hypothetical protein